MKLALFSMRKSVFQYGNPGTALIVRGYFGFLSLLFSGIVKDTLTLATMDDQAL